ncbi:tRNA(Met) cytidine acetyltransferase [Glaciecola sp. MH2013]|uniref:GNAT family N-acetyltransferase n=1 Tax=Glaciecola sp. MH2013 TaxID=2785524 RepID=UPI0018A0A2F6|nr:GNAT family N-acetyltransferase [Glaciecola sp. MH2013]MBF7072446.1 tRNA(Met) cytidine acetyltransferase [Glaciecola sp. MH2013]
MDLQQWLKLRQDCDCHRQLLLISGSKSWACKQVLRLTPDRLAANTTKHASRLLVSNSDLLTEQQLRDESYPPLSTSSIKHYKQHLGSEYHCVIYNAFDGVKPSAMLALEGTVAKRGLFVILCPKLDDWPDYEAAQQGISFSYQEEQHFSYYTARLVAKSKNDCFTAILQESGPQHFPLAHAKQANAANEQARMRAISETQLHYKQQISSHFKQNGRCSIIRAKRGRGKSTLLGLIAFEFLLFSKATLYITAPTVKHCKKAIEKFTECQEEVLGSLTKEQQDGSLSFVPIDRLDELSSDSILFIDEAASIAPASIIKACGRFAHTILASTSVGYEGSGLGFNLKVLPKLYALGTKTKEFTLSSPIRWFENCVLEAVFEDIFVPEPKNTKTQILNNNTQEAWDAEKLCFQTFTPPELFQNEELLVDVFYMLLQSHYQTTPDDLMRLMDSERNFVVTAIAANSMLVAVANVVVEGNIKEHDENTSSLINGSRRFNGHLVAQNLATTFLESMFLQQKSWRISRVAVEHTVRKRGFGSALLRQIAQIANSLPLDNQPTFLSTSFGRTDELYRWWTKCDYHFIKFGLRKDTSSGERSVILIKPLSSISIDKVQQLIYQVIFRLHSLMANDKQNESFTEEQYHHMVNTAEIGSDKLLYTFEQLCYSLQLFIEGARPFSNVKDDLFTIIAINNKASQLSKWLGDNDNIPFIQNLRRCSLARLESAITIYSKAHTPKEIKLKQMNIIREEVITTLRQLIL